ncbi:MAG: L-threonylcarbamoyladenylate synthase [Bacteroidota bacterium]|nr:L-threonylcarbamoyladenylate synthase [Bacteroidota bacterium]
MLLKVHPDNPAPRHIKMITDCLRNGGVIIYPTDTVYGFGCDMNSMKAAERICMIKGLKPEKANFSFIFHDLSNLSDYTLQIDSNTFKLLKKSLPGPFTFILNANNKVPKLFKSKKKTIGIRIPDNLIPKEIVKELANPILSTSVYDPDEIIEYTTDPELIYERYKNQVDMVIDGGFGHNVASTIVDCTEGEPEIIRQGIGEL